MPSLKLLMPVSSKDFLDIQATIENRITLKHGFNIKTYSQMHHTEKCSQHHSSIWPVKWLSVYL